MSAKEVITSVNVEARKQLGVRPGDTVRVTQKIQEKGKTRLQVFEGLVLATKHGTEPGATFTVRKVASGVGVEKVFPLFSPIVDKIEIVKRTKVRRSKLYYIREKAAKVIRRSMRNAFVMGDSIESDIAEKERIAKEAEELEKKEVEEKAKQEEAEKSMSNENENEVKMEENAEEVTEEVKEKAEETQEPVEEKKEEASEEEPKKD